MPIVTFLPSGQRVEVPKGTTLFRAAKLAGLPLAASCDAEGVCGKCNLEVSAGDGSLSPRTDRERQALAAERCVATDRLACLARVQGDCTVRARYW